MTEDVRPEEGVAAGGEDVVFVNAHLGRCNADGAAMIVGGQLWEEHVA